MKKLIVTLLAVFLANICYAGSTPHQLTLDEKLFDLSQLVNMIKSDYAPKEYKKEKFGIDVDELSQKYVSLVKETKNNGEFYSLIIKFVAEFRDGHFRARIPSKYSAYLPFDVTLVQDRVVIEYVNREKLSKEAFPFDRGDELVEMDGKPVRELIEEFIPYLSEGNPRAAEGEAAYLLEWRPGSRVPVPSGNVSVTLKGLDGSKERTIEMEWLHKGEPYDENIISPVTSAMKALVAPDTPDTYDNLNSFDPTNLSIFDLINELRPVGESSYHCNPTTRIEIPKDATILMEKPFTAYYYPTAKGNVGYLRLSDFYPPDEDKDGKKDYDKWLEYYRWATDKLEKNTVGLIIDTDHNCGGDMFYMEELISLFMKDKFKPLIEQFRASKEELIKLEGWMQGFDRPYYMGYDAFMQLFELIEDSIGKGLFLTPKTMLRGDQLVQGLGIYTRPVIVLMDYFSASGGDAFPAMMQGFGRAKLLGTTTSGLGGMVLTRPRLFYSQIETDMTYALTFKPDGTPIENVGAEPDIEYEITINDFVNGFKDYRAFYTEELLKLIR